MSVLAAWRGVLRDWRSGDIQIIFWAVVVAVAGLVSVLALSDRLQQGLLMQGSELLAADLVVRTPDPPPVEWRRRGSELGLQTAQFVTLRSVVVTDAAAQLAEVKAVSPGYPLRGRLRVALSLSGPQTVMQQGPAAGTVWMDGQLLNRLGLSLGEEVRVGEARLEVAGVLGFEPDRGGSVFSIAPRLMMHQVDLAGTGLVQPGSLVRHRFLAAGTPDAVRAFSNWLLTQGVAPNDLQTVRNAQPRFRAALDRGERFLALASLVSVLLAGIAIARGARHYADRHIDDVAVQRCFGASQRFVVSRYLSQLVFVALSGGLIGCALGYAGHGILLRLLPGISELPLPAASLIPAALGLALSLVTVLGFGLPDILRLRNVAPLRVIRRDLDPLPPRTILVYGLAAVTMVLLVVLVAHDFRLVAWAIGGTAATLVCLAASAWGLVRALTAGRAGVGIEWRFGIANLARRFRSTLGQIVSLGLGVMAILLLTVVRQDLFEQWQTRLPATTPNHFLINIQSDQVSKVEKFLADRNLTATRFTPILRARLAAINGQAVDPENYPRGFARRAVQRAANLSWTEKLPPDNRLVDGEWWTAEDNGGGWLSVEKGYAESLGLALGDRVTYRVAEREFTVTVHNLREVSWDSFSPNFFLLVPPGLFADYPVSYITSLYTPQTQPGAVFELVREFPNITDIDVAAVLSQVRQVLDRIAAAMQYLFFFATLAGLVVLYASLHTSRGERLREIAVLRVLGAGSGQVRRGLVAEFAILGLLAGTVGGFGATLVGYVLAVFVFNLDYTINPWVVVAGTIAATSVVTLMGPWVCRRELRAPPWQVLRNAGGAV